MYSDVEEPTSLIDSLNGVIIITFIGIFIYGIVILIRKLKARKPEKSFLYTLKLLWLIASLKVIIWLSWLFFLELTIKDGNRRFMEYLPYQNGLLGILCAFIASMLLFTFCISAIIVYFDLNKNSNK